MPITQRQPSPLNRHQTDVEGYPDAAAPAHVPSPALLSPFPTSTNSGGSSTHARMKRRTPVPYASLLPLQAQRIAEGLTYAIIFPYINQMILDMGVEEKSVGVWSAIAESVMMGTEAISAPFYGPLADRFGRRPVLIVLELLWGVFGTLFGFSTSVWMAIMMRGALGLLAGCGVISRTMVGEMCDKSNRVQAFALFSPALVIGMTLAPVLGGFLANPVPRLLSPSWTLFVKYPYLPPALLTGSTAIISGILSIMFLPETLRPTKLHVDLNDPEKSANSGLRGLLRYLPFQKVLFLYGMQNAVQYSWEAIYPLYGFTSKNLGGLGVSTQALGLVLGLSAGLSIAMTVLVFPIFHGSMTESTCLKVCLSAYPVAVLFFPVIWAMSYPYEGDNLPFSAWIVISMQMIMRRAGDFAATQLDTLVLDFIPGPEHLASANAITFSVAAIGRAFGPFIISYFFSLSTHFASPFSPGRQLVWVIFILLSIPSIILAHRLLDEGPNNKEDREDDAERYELLSEHERERHLTVVEGRGGVSQDASRPSSSIEVYSEEAIRYRAS
ncbi:hypothetical protein I317_02072 [Kwoniella heveanensis CBS 569]|nr:hypothetical protein I317_02072 [Kwoniella heveanensis CBS 569]